MQTPLEAVPETVAGQPELGWLRGRLAPLAVGAAATGAAVVAYVVEPAKTSWLPKCPLHALTGLYCPGCGATRALHELTHGNVADALHNNALLLLFAPLLAAAWFVWMRNPGSGKRLDVGAKTGVVIAAVFALFTIARNVPVSPFDLIAPIG